MAKDKEFKKPAESEEQSMSAAEARAYRRSLRPAQAPEALELTDHQKRDEFRKFWAEAKAKYGKSKDLEPILWVHLKAVKMDSPEQFEAGIAHFGLKKVR